jgi:hypothetical protein
MANEFRAPEEYEGVRSSLWTPGMNTPQGESEEEASHTRFSPEEEELCELAGMWQEMMTHGHESGT